MAGKQGNHSDLAIPTTGGSGGNEQDTELGLPVTAKSDQKSQIRKSAHLTSQKFQHINMKEGQKARFWRSPENHHNPSRWREKGYLLYILRKCFQFGSHIKKHFWGQASKLYSDTIMNNSRLKKGERSQLPFWETHV